MYEVERLPQNIDIGYTGEQDCRTIEIDMSAWVAKVPDGQPILMHIRPGESEPYPVEITFEDNILTWSVSDEDLGTKEGTGLLQVWFGVEDEEQVLRQLGMSAVVATIVHLSLAGEGNNSSTVQIPWLKEVMEMKNIILGYDYEAESWAVGKRGGTDVPSTDPAYHNNAKYFSEQASAAKTAAEAAQEAAETAAERDVEAWLEENFTNPDSPPLDRTLALNTCAAPADMVGNLKSAFNTFTDNVEDYLYSELSDDTFVFTGIADFNLLDSILYAGKQYIVKIKFQNITNDNLTKITAIRLYAGTSSLTAHDDLTFEVPYAQMHEGVVYATYYSPSSTTRNTLLVAFGSNASFSTDNVEITVEDMTVRFAEKATEAVAKSVQDALIKTLSIGDIQFTTGSYQKTDGTTAANANFKVSDFIKINEGLTVTYTIHGYNSVAVVCVFAEDKTTVKRYVSSNSEQDLTGTLTFQEGEEYIRFCRWSTSKGANDTISMKVIMDVSAEINRIDTEMATVGDTQWNGKVWHCFGTSISNASNEGKYPPYLVALSGLQYNNFGYSGGKLTNQILAQIKADSGIANADLITVEGFVNDWSQQSPLGQITDTTADTFYGAMYDAITYILSHSNATLVFITDSTGRSYNSIDLRREAVRNGKTQNDFIEATIRMCNYMGVPVIDAGRKSCISQDTATLYLADQIHHTEKGGEQYAQTIWAELKNIKPRIV